MVRLSTLKAVFAGAAVAIAADNACGQATVPSIFVSNNGNLEGSVSAFSINPNGTLQFVNRIITGSRLSLSDPCAGCNAYEISITPNGRYLATGHAAGDLDGITIFQVGSNAAVTQVLQLPLGAGVGGPLDVVWIDDQYLATTRLDTNPDQIVIYRFIPAGPTLTALTFTPVGTSMGYLAVHPSRQYLYANDSAIKMVFAFRIGVNGVLTQIDSESSGLPFPLELAISPDGTKMYCAGGISAGGQAVAGMDIAPNGTLTIMPGSPFSTLGSSPSNVWVTGDNATLIAGHGTDATMRSLAINAGTGAVTPTGNVFDVGLQGTLGDVRTQDNLVFVTDNSTATDGLMGIYSFTLGPGGTFTQNGSINLTNGIAPRSIATWKPPAPPCPADIVANGLVNVDDLLAVINSWGACRNPPAPCPSDIAPAEGNGLVNVDDLLAVINTWGACP